MNKDFLKNSKNINSYFKVLKRISKYAPNYRKRFKSELKYAMKYNKHFMSGGTTYVIPRFRRSIKSLVEEFTELHRDEPDFYNKINKIISSTNNFFSNRNLRNMSIENYKEDNFIFVENIVPNPRQKEIIDKLLLDYKNIYGSSNFKLSGLTKLDRKLRYGLDYNHNTGWLGDLNMKNKLPTFKKILKIFEKRYNKSSSSKCVTNVSRNNYFNSNKDTEYFRNINGYLNRIKQVYKNINNTSSNKLNIIKKLSNNKDLNNLKNGICHLCSSAKWGLNSFKNISEDLYVDEIYMPRNGDNQGVFGFDKYALKYQFVKGFDSYNMLLRPTCSKVFCSKYIQHNLLLNTLFTFCHYFNGFRKNNLFPLRFIFEKEQEGLLSIYKKTWSRNSNKIEGELLGALLIPFIDNRTNNRHPTEFITLYIYEYDHSKCGYIPPGINHNFNVKDVQIYDWKNKLVQYNLLWAMRNITYREWIDLTEYFNGFFYIYKNNSDNMILLMSVINIFNLTNREIQENYPYYTNEILSKIRSELREFKYTDTYYNENNETLFVKY